jgi:hypothetical protein
VTVDEEQLLIEGVMRAAARLRVSGPLPPRSEDVLRFAVRDQLRAHGLSDVAHEAASITGGWTPIPGRLDLHAPMVRPLRWAAEAKVWDIDQQLWDALKLAAGIAHGDTRAGYLLAAACPTAFAHAGGAELFRPSAHEHVVAELIRTNAPEWLHLLGGGAGRPIQVPARIRTTLLCDHWCWFGHRVRLVRVEIDANADVVQFIDGWPEGLDGPTAVAEARAARRGGDRDALGLRVPPRWSDSWWQRALRASATADQFEALYGLLLTRGWTDADIRSRVAAPDGGAPAWWT